MSDKYSAAVRWSDEDECFIATVPELPTVSAFGDTPAEALAELEVAKGLLLESWREKGVEPPEPRKAASHSGQVRLRMPKSLHASLAEEAEREGVSLNTYMLTLLAARNERNTVSKSISHEVLRNIAIKRIVKYRSGETEIVGTNIGIGDASYPDIKQYRGYMQ